MPKVEKKQPVANYSYLPDDFDFELDHVLDEHKSVGVAPTVSPLRAESMASEELIRDFFNDHLF